MTIRKTILSLLALKVENLTLDYALGNITQTDCEKQIKIAVNMYDDRIEMHEEQLRKETKIL